MSRTNAELNLLFGLVALRLDFVTSETLVRGLSSWVERKSGSLGRILLDQGDLTEDDYAVLEPLVRRHVERHGDDPARSLATATVPTDVRTKLQAVNDPDLQSCLERIPLERGPESAIAVSRSNAEGARPLRLRRWVRRLWPRRTPEPVPPRDPGAKDVPPALAANVSATNGQAGQPHAVPPADVPDPSEVAVLPWSESDSFAEGMARFHEGQAARSDPRARLAALRVAVRSFAVVVDAITGGPWPIAASARAEGQGGDDPSRHHGPNAGVPVPERIPVDWGRARRTDPTASTTVAGPPSILLLPPDAGPPTRALAVMVGAAITSPPYMAPEQAAGRLDLLGPASDVYTFGALFYDLLTGQPPYEGADEPSVRGRILEGAFLMPREVDPGLPAELEALCLRAMARAPEDRLTDGQHFVRELRSWLETSRSAPSRVVTAEPPKAKTAEAEPVRPTKAPLPATIRMRPLLAEGPRPTGRAEIVGVGAPDWRLRGGLIASAAVASVLTALIAWPIAGALIRQAEARTDTHSQTARKSFLAACETIDAACRRLTDDPAWSDPKLAAARARMLDDARTFYRQFADEHKDDPSFAQERGHALDQVAALTAQVEGADQAIEAAQQALTVYAQRLTREPDNRTFRVMQAKGYGKLAVLMRDAGKSGDAETAYKQALTDWEALSRRHPEMFEYRAEWASALQAIGEFRDEAGRPTQAEEAFRKALELRKTLARDKPKVAAYRDQLAATHASLARIEDQTGRRDPAESDHKQALQLRQELTRELPKVASYRADLARSQADLGRFLAVVGRTSEAETAFRASQDLLESLVRETPEDFQVRLDLAAVRLDLGSLFRALGREGPAEEVLNASAEGLRELAQARPDSNRSRILLARVEVALCGLFLVTGRTVEAEAAAQRALALDQALERGPAAGADLQADLARAQVHRGRVEAAVGKGEAAEKSFKEALTIVARLRAENPDHVDYQDADAEYQDDLAALHFAEGRMAESEEARKKALITLIQLARSHPEIADYQDRLAVLRARMAAVYSLTRRAGEAEPMLAQALEAQEPLVRDHPDIIAYRRNLALTRYGLASVFTETRRPDDAERTYREALAVQDALAQEHPTITGCQAELAQTYNGMAHLFVRMKRDPEAVEYYRKAVILQETLAKAHPSEPGLALDLGKSYGNVGRYLSERGVPDKSSLWYDRAIATLQEVYKQQPKHGLVRVVLRNAHWGRAQALTPLGRFDEALSDWDQALRLDDGGLKNEFTLFRAATLARRGDHERAANDADTLIRSDPAGTAGLYHNAAWVFCLASDAARRDPAIPEAERASKADAYAARAVEILGKAHAFGFYTSPDNQKLLDYRDFDVVRGRPDFQALIAQFPKPETSIKPAGEAGPSD